MRYTFSNIANNSNVRLDSFYWRDVLPAEVRLETVITGTYNFPGTYKITYRVNGGEPRTLADNLSTSKNYNLAASATALGLAGNERVTEIMFVFGQAPGGFAQVEKPKYSTMSEIKAGPLGRRRERNLALLSQCKRNFLLLPAASYGRITCQTGNKNKGVDPFVGLRS